MAARYRSRQLFDFQEVEVGEFIRHSSPSMLHVQQIANPSVSDEGKGSGCSASSVLRGEPKPWRSAFWAYLDRIVAGQIKLQ